MTQRTDDQNGVKTTETSFDILEALMELNGARISELRDHLGMPKSTVHRHLSTLYRNRYVIKDGDTYRISVRFLALGNHAKNRDEVYKLASEKVEELAEKTGERVQFVVEEHGRAVYVHVARGENAVKHDSRLGKTFPIHVAAASKVILAHLPENRVQEIIDAHGLTQVTNHSITDPDSLFEELEMIRERGYAYHREEYLDGLLAVGVPILIPGGQVIGGMSIGGPKHRLKGDPFETELPNLLLGASNEIELNIKYI